jgi:hypothetical protein
VRAYLDSARVTEICAAHGIEPADAVATIQRVLRFGPAALGDEREGVRFWSAVWDALGLEEVYAEIPDPSAVRVAPSVDLDLGEVLARLPEWTRVHLSSVAVESLAQTLELLHPEGVLQLQDLFVRDLGEYSSFRGPGKIEGSIVEGSNIVVLTARRRDASSDERLLASDEDLLSARAAA